MSSLALMPEDGSGRDSKSRRSNVAGVTTALNRGRAGDPTNTRRSDGTTRTGARSANCDAFSFLPGNVTDGVGGPADDPIYQIRLADYLVSSPAARRSDFRDGSSAGVTTC